MLKSKLDKFMVKRAVIVFLFMTAVDMILPGVNRWLVFAGLLTGAVISIVRLIGNEWILKKVFQYRGEKVLAGSIAVFTLSQMVVIPVIVIPYYYSVWFFYGVIAGILTAPAVIMINSITEAFGITKNSFE